MHCVWLVVPLLMSSTVHRTVNSPSFNMRGHVHGCMMVLSSMCGHPCPFLFTQTATNLGRKLSQAGVKVDHYGSLDIDSDPKQQLELIQVL